MPYFLYSLYFWLIECSRLLTILIDCEKIDKFQSDIWINPDMIRIYWDSFFMTEAATEEGRWENWRTIIINQI